mmetsp:Transcript_13594/g.59322  ORF Transcript_13594/g.59322 Transcript_13594/m.59322 type:complete len:459 (-) Transcript_13594:135-1511(-)
MRVSGQGRRVEGRRRGGVARGEERGGGGGGEETRGDGGWRRRPRGAWRGRRSRKGAGGFPGRLRVGRRPGTRDAAGEEEGAGKVLQGANRRVQDQEGAFAGARRHPGRGRAAAGDEEEEGRPRRRAHPDGGGTRRDCAAAGSGRRGGTREGGETRREGGSPARVPRREAGVQTGDRVCGSGGGFGRAGVHKSREAPRASQRLARGAAGGAEGLEKARGRPERPRRAHAPPTRSVAKQPHDRSQQGGHHPAQARGRGGDGGRGASPRDEPEPASRRRNVPAMPIAAEQARQVLRLRLRRVRVRKRPGVEHVSAAPVRLGINAPYYRLGAVVDAIAAPDQREGGRRWRRQRDRRSRREGRSVRRVQARPGLRGDVRHEVRQGVLHSLARRDRALDAAAGAERKGAAAVRRVQNSGDHAEALRHRAGRAGVRSKASRGGRSRRRRSRRSGEAEEDERGVDV